MASTVNHSSQRGEYRRARTLHPFVTNRVLRFAFFFSFLFFFFFFARKSLVAPDKEKSIPSINGKKRRRRRGGIFDRVSFPIWRGKEGKTDATARARFRSHVLSSATDEERALYTRCTYVREEDTATKVERESSVRAVAVYTGYKIRCLERLSAWSRLSLPSEYASPPPLFVPPPLCHLRFRLERNTVYSERVVQIVP